MQEPGGAPGQATCRDQGEKGGTVGHEHQLPHPSASCMPGQHNSARLCHLPKPRSSAPHVTDCKWRHLQEATHSPSGRDGPR